MNGVVLNMSAGGAMNVLHASFSSSWKCVEYATDEEEEEDDGEVADEATSAGASATLDAEEEWSGWYIAWTTERLRTLLSPELQLKSMKNS